MADSPASQDSVSQLGLSDATPPKPLCWIEIPVSDVRAAAQRLNALFGWTVREPHTSAFALMMTGNHEPVGLSLVLRETAEGGNDEPMTTLVGVNIGVDTIEEVYADALNTGFMPVEPPHAVPQAGHGMRAVIRDPDGNLFGLWRD